MQEKDLDVPVYEKRTIRKAVKLKCLDCCGGSWNEVKLCNAKDSCFLHPFRLGKNPWATVMTDEQKQAARDRLAKLREEGKWQ